MISNLVEYFSPEQEFYLNNISYQRIDKTIESDNHSLNCTDSINVDVYGDECVRVLVSRVLEFNPEELFEMSISFGAILRFVPEKVHEHDWNNINMAEEFRYNGEFVTGNLMARISLLIAQITSSFGQLPLVLPPNVTQN